MHRTAHIRRLLASKPRLTVPLTTLLYALWCAQDKAEGIVLDMLCEASP